MSKNNQKSLESLKSLKYTTQGELVNNVKNIINSKQNIIHQLNKYKNIGNNYFQNNKNHKFTIDSEDPILTHNNIEHYSSGSEPKFLENGSLTFFGILFIIIAGLCILVNAFLILSAKYLHK
jgi:hypothetical protein